MKAVRWVIAGLVLISAGVSMGELYTFDSLQHGEIVNSQVPGLTVQAINIGGGPDLALAFDTTRTGTRDPDLENPWSGGNLPWDTDLGHLLILAENGRDANNDGLVDNPDDEGSRPAGSLIFGFDTPVAEFGFDLVDVEGPTEFGNDAGYAALFFSGGSLVARIGFGDFIDPTSPHYLDGVEYGNRYANRIDPIQASTFGSESFSRVEINLGGSAGVDNIRVRVPEKQVPDAGATSLLLGVAMAALVVLKRVRG